MEKPKRWTDYSEDEILQANIEKYDQEHIISFYQDFEEPRYSYIEYEIIFKAVLDHLAAKLDRPVSAVDMCGGAGKAAFVLKGCDPACQATLVDCSDKMLDIARDRIQRQKIEGIDVVLGDAFSFLNQEKKYDLIVFSSAVHHFKEPVKLLQTAAGCLTEQGLIVTIADPTTLTKSRRYKFFEFMLSNSDIKKMKLKRMFKPKTDEIEDEDFDLAEYQTFTGINDVKLAGELKEVGLHPVVHLRYPAGEPYMTKIMPWIGLCWAFSMIISPQAPQDNQLEIQRLKQTIKQEMPFRFKYL
ncbi:MAG: class I SAM-dependent methyltransferase [Syntrophomonadaceae bacterium]|nr:class I SAM-dependent methyltransferase [Syntrophomonadaceae bacterium]